MFKKGEGGRQKGVKNNLSTSSLRTLLENAFLRNQSAAIAKIDQIFQQADLNDFKWLCSVKASLEPKVYDVSGNINLEFSANGTLVSEAERANASRN